MTHPTKAPPARRLMHLATLAIVSIASMSATQTASAADPKAAAKIKSKQCVVFYSPRYKKLRIKPIQISYRWCSKAKPADCTKWENDAIADKGKPFTIAAYCFTHGSAITMDLRYNKRFGDGESRAQVKLKPHAMKLKDNLAPHPFCGTKASHHFVMRRDSASIKPGKPRDAEEPKCVWKPIKSKSPT